MKELRMVLVDDHPQFIEKISSLIRRTARAVGVRADFYTIAGTDSAKGKPRVNASLNDFMRELSDIQRGKTSDRAITKKVEAADLSFVDFDLRGADVEGGLITGERVAQLLRLSVPTGPIVSLDRRLMRTFDLNHRRPTITNADLMLRWEDLGVRSLWGGKPSDYDPWYWPNLVELASNYSKRVDFVAAHYDRSIVSALEVPDEIRATLPGDDARLALDFRTATFDQVTKASLPKNPSFVTEGCRHRISASVVGSWLQSTVLPPQDVLIDAPHLVRHCPSLLRGGQGAGNLAKLVTKRVDAKVPLDSNKLKSHRFKHGVWVDRPVWWLSGVLNDHEIKDIAEPWTKPTLRLEFAEDESRFVRRQSLSPYESEGFFGTRFVRGRSAHSSIEYVPPSRLAG